jgi:hypothetical protein
VKAFPRHLPCSLLKRVRKRSPFLSGMDRGDLDGQAKQFSKPGFGPSSEGREREFLPLKEEVKLPIVIFEN